MTVNSGHMTVNSTELIVMVMNGKPSIHLLS